MKDDLILERDSHKNHVENWKNILFMYKPNEHTKEALKNMDINQKINAKINIFWRNYPQSKGLPKVAMLAASINQSHYVISGDCKRNSERYKREILRQRI